MHVAILTSTGFELEVDTKIYIYEGVVGISKIIPIEKLMEMAVFPSICIGFHGAVLPDFW